MLLQFRSTFKRNIREFLTLLKSIMFKQFEKNVTKIVVQVSDVAHGLLFSNPVKSMFKIHVMIVPASYA